MDRASSGVKVLQPRTASPLDIQGVDIDVDTVEIVALIREGRERFGRGGPATTSE